MGGLAGLEAGAGGQLDGLDQLDGVGVDGRGAGRRHGPRRHHVSSRVSSVPPAAAARRRRGLPQDSEGQSQAGVGAVEDRRRLVTGIRTVCIYKIGFGPSTISSWGQVATVELSPCSEGGQGKGEASNCPPTGFPGNRTRDH